MALHYYLREHLCRQADPCPAVAAAHPAPAHKGADSSKMRSGILNKQEVAARKLPEGIWPADNPSDHLAFNIFSFD